jgi:hypothetical protein
MAEAHTLALRRRGFFPPTVCRNFQGARFFIEFKSVLPGSSCG